MHIMTLIIYTNYTSFPTKILLSVANQRKEKNLPGESTGVIATPAQTTLDYLFPISSRKISLTMSQVSHCMVFSFLYFIT